MNNDNHIADLTATLALCGESKLGDYQVFNEFDEAPVEAVRQRWGSLADRAVAIVACLGDEGVDITVPDLVDLLERCTPPDCDRPTDPDTYERCVNDMLNAYVIDASGPYGIVFAIAVARVAFSS